MRSPALSCALCMGATLVIVSLEARTTQAQSFGAELHNTTNPAAGAMGGVSIVRPQDIQSAINSNPATLTQFHGTQFSFGGAWVEPTYDLAYDGSVPALNALGFAAFNRKSGAPGASLGSIGIIQDMRQLGLPVVTGIGFGASTGFSGEWRQAPGSNGTTITLQGLDIINSVGVELSPRWSLGASVRLTAAVLDGPFVGNSAATSAYSLRGNIGLTYLVNCDTTLGVYYQSKEEFHFGEAISFAGGTFQDVELDLPHNLGFGFANRSLMCGNLLIACDVLYKQWTNTDLFGAVWEDQWVFQVGAQYTRGKVKYRLGYAFAENVMRDIVDDDAGGVAPPGAVAAVQYLQGTLPAINEHRLTAGVGMSNVLPGVDFDLMAGGMFPASQTFGGHTTASVESYWVGLGITWRFGRGGCERLPPPDDWSAASLPSLRLRS